MPQKCRVCNHPARKKIEAAIIAGQSNRSIALQWNGFSHAAVARHKGHMDGTVVETAVGKRKEMFGDNLLTEINRIKDDAGAIYAEAKKKKDHRIALLALEKQQKSIELLANMMLKLREIQAIAGQDEPIKISWERTTP